MFASYKKHLQYEKMQEGKNKPDEKDSDYKEEDSDYTEEYSDGSDKNKEEESYESIKLLKTACDRVFVLDENKVTHDEVLDRLKKCCCILELFEAYNNDLATMAANTICYTYWDYISEDDRINNANQLVDSGFTSK